MLPSKPLDIALILDIRESVSLVGDYVAGLSEDQFKTDLLRRDASAFRLLLIGEAVSKLSADVTGRLPEIDWRGMISLRHRLAHDYGSTNFSVVWTIVSNDVPALDRALKDL